MARGPAKGPVAVQSAMRYSNAKAEEILQKAKFGGLRDRIVALFAEEKMTSMQIAEAIHDEMQLRVGVKIQTASSIIRRVLAVLVDDDSREEVHSTLHANALERRRDEIDTARDKWMSEHGYRVWTNEEDEYFLELIQRTDMKRGSSDICDHKKIAAAMCEKFGPDSFDAKRCRRHLESMRRIGHVEQSTVNRIRKIQTNGHAARQRIPGDAAEATGEDQKDYS